MIKQKGMLYDVTLCVGCGACYNACKEQNKLPATNKDYLKDHLSDKTYTVLEQYGELYSRKNCMHCKEPACVSVCPVGAFKKTELGPVVYDVDKCIGCRYCMQACPHKVPRYEWSSLNPRVRKCVLCYDRLKKGLPTACSEACPSGATMFGDLDDLVIEAKKRLKENPSTYYQSIYGLKDAGGSNILVISPVPFEQLGFTSHLSGEPLPKLTANAMEKIPGVVSVGALCLGGLYWLTKRKNEIAKEERLQKKESINHEK
jgi:formate dehydrogenase iron-sulfur subunit